jgi:hypothetical protein
MHYRHRQGEQPGMLRGVHPGQGARHVEGKARQARHGEVGRVGPGDGSHDLSLSDACGFQDGQVRAIANDPHVGGAFPLQAWDFLPLHLNDAHLLPTSQQQRGQMGAPCPTPTITTCLAMRSLLT